MVRMFVVVAVAAAVAGGCKKDAPAPSEAPAPDEAKAIEQVVTGAMEAGFERNAIDEYLAAWADDATIVGGRGEAPGPYDVTLDRRQIEATRRLRASMPGIPPMKVRFEDLDVKVDGETARLRCRTIVEIGGESTETVGETYDLRKAPAGWRIVKNRYWMLGARYGGEERTYDEAGWKALDAAVEQARGGDREGLTRALLDAWRMEEAWKEAQALLTEQPESLPAHQLAATVGRLVGRPDEALAIYRTIATRWPDVEVPSLAKEGP